jgi:hypothetical protein
MHIMTNSNGEKPFLLDASHIARIETELGGDELVMSLVHDLQIAKESMGQAERVADLEEQITELEGERDEAREERDSAQRGLKEARDAFDALKCSINEALAQAVLARDL